MKCQIKITLLSDMCVSDGGVYNSMLDTDICSSPEGFPYIPAKRLRGCLRECALELKDWGYSINPNELFGTEGDAVSAVRLGDAQLEDIEEMTHHVSEGQWHMLFHPQNVLNHFSYIRTQTSINNKTGTADAKSLRTMRVAAKGLVFISNAEVRADLYDCLEACCNVLSGMGIGRTRGLGEVTVSMRPFDESVLGTGDNESTPSLIDGADCLEFEITLQEPMIVKSIRGDQEKSKDYLEGSKIFGYVLENLKSTMDKDDAYEKLRGICCTNAYIKVNGERGVEIPASFYMVKDQPDTYIDKAFETEEARIQFENNVLTHIKHCYVNEMPDGSLIRETVDLEERYHHRRSEDKSIGRADSKSNEDADFYQISSISSGQTFCGSILGTPEQIRLVYNVLRSQQKGLMGYSRMSEYGLVNVRVTGSSIRKTLIMSEVKHLRISLNSPAIIYNEKAMYSTSLEMLLEEVCCALGLTRADISSKEQYLRYTHIGGYNVTWNARTPVIEGFDKGSTLVIHLKEAKSLTIEQPLMIGERIGEGYGELIVRVMEEPFGKHYTGNVKDEDLLTVDKKRNTIIEISSGFAKELADDLFIQYIRLKAVENAKCGVWGPKERPTVSNMLLMAEESNRFEDVKISVRERYDKMPKGKEEKKKIAENILKHVEKIGGELVQIFERDYKISGYTVDEDRLLMEYLTAYLSQLKYRIRQSSNKEEVG